MMKQTVLIFTIALIFLTKSTAQTITGQYSEKSDFISFTLDSVKFKIESNGGLVVDLHGSGTYEVFDNFLMIKTLQNQGIKSTHNTTKNQNDKVNVTVFDPEHKPIMGVNVVLTDSLNNFLFGTATNENGIAIIEKVNLADKITLSLVGFDTYTIDYSDKTDYQIKLMDYETIENQTLVFKINSLSNDSLKLTLLTTDFTIKGEKEKELNKLYKDSKNNISRERILIKK